MSKYQGDGRTISLNRADVINAIITDITMNTGVEWNNDASAFVVEYSGKYNFNILHKSRIDFTINWDMYDDLKLIVNFNDIVNEHTSRINLHLGP